MEYVSAMKMDYRKEAYDWEEHERERERTYNSSNIMEACFHHKKKKVIVMSIASWYLNCEKKVRIALLSLAILTLKHQDYISS